MEPAHYAVLAVFGVGALLILAVILKPRKDRAYRDTRNLDTSSHLTNGGGGGGGGAD